MQRIGCVKEMDKTFWNHIVHKVLIDPHLKQQPKVYASKEEEIKETTHKCRANGELGPYHQGPNSAERKDKGPRHIDRYDDNQGESTESDEPDDNELKMDQDSEETDAEIAEALQVTSTRKDPSAAQNTGAPETEPKKTVPLGQANGNSN